MYPHPNACAWGLQKLACHCASDGPGFHSACNILVAGRACGTTSIKSKTGVALPPYWRGGPHTVCSYPGRRPQSRTAGRRVAWRENGATAPHSPMHPLWLQEVGKHAANVRAHASHHAVNTTKPAARTKASGIFPLLEQWYLGSQELHPPASPINLNSKGPIK